MIPALPGDALVVVAALVVVVCVGLYLLIMARRVWILWWGRSEDALADKMEGMILQWLQGGIPTATVTRYAAKPARKHILALLKAVAKVEASGRIELRERLREANLPVLLERALHPKRDRWTRAAAARALGVLAYSEGLPALIKCLDDDDPNVAYTAASSIATLNLPDAAAPLLDRVGKNTKLNNARLVAMVEQMKVDLRPHVKEMMKKDDPIAAFWALGLIAEKKMFEFIEEVRPFLSSPDANVRAAAAECVGRLRINLTDRWLDPLLDDEAWFVRCHAAKALGEMKATWAADRMAPLLHDKVWWCRHNGADAMVMLGAASMPALEQILERSEDAFARQSAVGALERIGWFEETIRKAMRNDQRAMALLHKAGADGGIGYLENALTMMEPEAIGAVLDLLAALGDKSTAGRIKRAIHQKLIPEEYFERAREVAAAFT